MDQGVLAIFIAFVLVAGLAFYYARRSRKGL